MEWNHSVIHLFMKMMENPKIIILSPVRKFDFPKKIFVAV